MSDRTMDALQQQLDRSRGLLESQEGFGSEDGAEAADEIRRMVAAWRRVLSEHEPDAENRCRGCTGSRRRPSWPCTVWLDAHQLLLQHDGVQLPQVRLPQPAPAPSNPTQAGSARPAPDRPVPSRSVPAQAGPSQPGPPPSEVPGRQDSLPAPRGAAQGPRWRSLHSEGTSVHRATIRPREIDLAEQAKMQRSTGRHHKPDQEG